MTSRGYATDLIESICELITVCGHLREMLDGEEDVKEIYIKALKYRRGQMERLLDLAEVPNPKYHCVVKHLLGSWWRSVEVWEATGEDKDYEMAKRIGDLAASALSQYLGMEFESCSRCLFDLLTVKQLEGDFDKIEAKGEK